MSRASFHSRPREAGIGTDELPSSFAYPAYPGLVKPNFSRNRSSSPMLGRIGLAQPTLEIHLAEELLYLHPTPEGVPSEDPWVSGTITLWLPKVRTLKRLTVRLQGRQDLGWPEPRPYESNISLDKEVTLFDTDVVLPKGEHVFEFSIIVPSSTPSYERCRFGRVRHHISCKAMGVGSMGGDVVSEEKQLFLIVNPGGGGESRPPPPLHYKSEGLLPDLGPYTMALQSQHVMVGGLMLFRFNLISPPTDILISSIKVKIIQHFTLRSPLDPLNPVNVSADIASVLILDASHPPNMGRVDSPSSGVRSGSHTPNIGPLKIVGVDSGGYKISHLSRLPNDNSIRPSTQEGSDAGIHVRHEIAFEMTYRSMDEEVEKDKGKGKNKEKERDKEKKKLSITKPLDIYSCCCFLDSLTLPVYSFFDPNPEPETYSPPCVCGIKLSELIRRHGDTLLRDEGEDGLTYAPILKDGEQRSGQSTPVGSRGRPLIPATSSE